MVLFFFVQTILLFLKFFVDGQIGWFEVGWLLVKTLFLTWPRDSFCASSGLWLFLLRNLSLSQSRLTVSFA